MSEKVGFILENSTTSFFFQFLKYEILYCSPGFTEIPK